MRRLALAAALLAALAPPLHAQTAKDTARAVAVKSATDSLRRSAAGVKEATDTVHQRVSILGAELLTVQQQVAALQAALGRMVDSLARTDELVLTIVRTAQRVDSIEAAALVAPPPPPVDTTPTPPDTTPPAPIDSTMPQPPTAAATVAWQDPYPTKPPTLTLASGANVSGALATARGGAVVCLANGGSFGPITLPARQPSDTGWIVLKACQLSTPEGTRMRPTAAAADALPRVTSSTVASTLLATVPGAHHYYVAGLEVTHSAPVLAYDVVRLGDGSAAQNTLASVPTDLVLSRMYVHGQSTQQLSRCVALNSARTAIVDSWLDQCHGKGQDAQAIAGWNGPGPYRIVNNTLIGSGENVMFGGADPAIPQLIPSDIELRGNHVVTPIAWKGVWTRKNLLETKNVRRLLVDGNVFEGSWSDGQTGWAMVLKSSNQSGRCTWCQSSDITVTNNVIRSVGAGINLAGREGTNQNPIGGLLARVVVQGNLIEQVGAAPYTGDRRMLQVLANAGDVRILGNTFVEAPGASIDQFLNLAKTSTATRLTVRDNVGPLGRYGVFGSGLGSGTVAFGGVATWTFTNNALVAAKPAANYPASTLFPTSLAAALQVPGVGVDTARVRAATARVVVTP